ncbi:hypothetical protein VSS74_07765 [Conexibacter stalactiti]|uniref:Antitoxin Xre/MbcA/ParS-like toxin-binding domain-containing protein n=1 Tax=Conexibacter stalactiti TaxID=1940611 RepID=A0ABU4HLR1_9ACTN|nr:hypothetical protein [Conexibacter stalactiti]MDW5594227.1 hypothetical protein [Conexibacter stalactiti]MEC5034869.1 hypothetical protein [Conexibacter stalactiti]
MSVEGWEQQKLEDEIQAVTSLASGSFRRIAARSPEMDLDELDGYTVEEAARLLNREVTAIHGDLAARRMLVFESEDGPALPAFQFSDGAPAAVLPVVAQILDVLGPVCIDPRTLTAWFVAPKEDLDHRRPMECLSTPELHDAIVLAARRDAARLA